MWTSFLLRWVYAEVFWTTLLWNRGSVCPHIHSTDHWLQIFTLNFAVFLSKDWPDSMSLIVFWERWRTLTIAWASPLAASSKKFWQGLLWELLLCSPLPLSMCICIIKNNLVLRTYGWHILENKMEDQESPHNPIQMNMFMIKYLMLKSFAFFNYTWVE